MNILYTVDTCSIYNLRLLQINEDGRLTINNIKVNLIMKNEVERYLVEEASQDIPKIIEPFNCAL